MEKSLLGNHSYRRKKAAEDRYKKGLGKLKALADDQSIQTAEGRQVKLANRIKRAKERKAERMAEPKVRAKLEAKRLKIEEKNKEKGEAIRLDRKHRQAMEKAKHLKAA